MTSLKIFFAYGLGNGWQVFSNPVIEYDWEGDSDNQLFVPLGAGVSKTTRIRQHADETGLRNSEIYNQSGRYWPGLVIYLQFHTCIAEPVHEIALILNGNPG